MPFGKHKGVPLRDVPASYLSWLLGSDCRLGSGFRREIVADLDRRARLKARRAEQLDAPLPTATPRDVCGFWLGPIEAGLFEAACRAGALVISPDLPCASILPAAWKAHCLAAHKSYRVRELTLADVGADPAGGSS
jgi:Putative quorum-sensing-regulated virulence factor